MLKFLAPSDLFLVIPSCPKINYTYLGECSVFIIDRNDGQSYETEGKNQTKDLHTLLILTMPVRSKQCSIKSKLLGAISTVCGSFVRFMPSVCFLIQHL